MDVISIGYLCIAVISLIVVGIDLGLRHHFDDVPHVNKFPQDKRKQKEQE